MFRPCVILAIFASVVPTFAAPVPKVDVKDPITLKDHINVKMDENLHSEAYPNNNLKSLKAGVQKLGDVTYDIGEGILQLGSASVKEKPEKIEGIKVGRTAGKLHFLQGAGYSAENDTVVGKYVIQYSDKTKAEAEIVYGKDLVDWWAYPGKDAPTNSKIAWEGENEASKGFNAKIRLYTMTWTNPHPDKEITKIDFVATDVNQACAPFCVAITAEAAKAEPKKDDKKEEKKQDK
jgi:hypothetical protein